MKIEIENLKALIHGRELTAYQKALAMNEWNKLQLYVNDLEKLNIPAVSVAKRKVCRCLTKHQILDLERNVWKCVKCGTYQ